MDEFLQGSPYEFTLTVHSADSHTEALAQLCNFVNRNPEALNTRFGISVSAPRQAPRILVPDTIGDLDGPD